MFDFERLKVYQKVVVLNKEILASILNNKVLDKFLQDQLKRASISIALNLAEGTGRISKKDKRHFYVMSRSSLHESVALIQILFDHGFITELEYKKWYGEYEEISKMLLSLIRNARTL